MAARFVIIVFVNLSLCIIKLNYETSYNQALQSLSDPLSGGTDLSTTGSSADTQVVGDEQGIRLAHRSNIVFAE